MLINFHSHVRRSVPGEIHIYNLIVPVQGETMPEAGEGAWISAGIHPWYIDTVDYGGQLERLAKLAEQPRVKFIGECGLDKRRGPDFKLQQKVYEEQLLLAERLNKPVVLHCVGSFNEVVAIHKKHRVRVPVIIHGFNKKLQLAMQLLKEGFCFSFGAALLKPGSNAASVIARLDPGQYFLETDDQDIDIKAIYAAAAKLTKTTENQLQELIFAHLMSLLNRD